MKYSEIEFEIINCKNCDMEIPAYMEKYCIDCGQQIYWEQDKKKRARNRRNNLIPVNSKVW